MLSKTYLQMNVLEAAEDRIRWVFDNFDKVCVSFSGGKDSTVMLHMVAEEAVRRCRKFGCMFIDWEAQFHLTIEHVEAIRVLYADVAEFQWITVPLLTTNATSMIEPEWTCWEPGRVKDWVREKPQCATSDFPFLRSPMTFEEFVPAYNSWYANGDSTAFLVGIRCNESLNRFRAIIREDKNRYADKAYTTNYGHGVVNVYPLYDWRTEDIWRYHAAKGMPYNRLYDLMHKAGLTIHQMRICEPYGDEQRQSLWLYHVLEPESWGKIVARVNGANTGALYAKDSGNILGNRKVTKPHGHTWESFAELLLTTIPEKTAEHYRDKFSVWLKWYQDRQIDIADELPGDTSAKDMPSWRRICKVLLKNDYWCKALCFSPNKAHNYEKYQERMKKRRLEWGIYGTTADEVQS